MQGGGACCLSHWAATISRLASARHVHGISAHCSLLENWSELPPGPCKCATRAHQRGTCTQAAAAIQECVPWPPSKTPRRTSPSGSDGDADAPPERARAGRRSERRSAHAPSRRASASCGRGTPSSDGGADPLYEASPPPDRHQGAHRASGLSASPAAGDTRISPCSFCHGDLEQRMVRPRCVSATIGLPSVATRQQARTHSVLA